MLRIAETRPRVDVFMGMEDNIEPTSNK